MKYYIYTVLLLLLTASCSDDVQKWDQWPEWKLASPLSVGGQVLDEEIYSNFQGKNRGDLSGRIMVLRSQLGTSSSEAGYHKRLEYGRT